MYWLLNPRVWVAAVVLVALGATHFAAYRSGKAVVRVAWDQEKAAHTAKLLAQEQSFRKKEQALVAARSAAEKQYADQKRKAATAATDADTELGRLRDTLAERDRELASSDSAASARVNGGARLERELLGHCAQALTDLAAEADRLEARIVGLQGYVRGVCQNGTAVK